MRDMYNPACYDDPVSADDKNVICDPDVDKGGVHYNSGLPNQVYSLFVDGGEFNGQSYTGVGLTKALHIYVRGLSKHVPLTTFMQHVDFLNSVSRQLNIGYRPNKGVFRLAMNSLKITWIWQIRSLVKLREQWLRPKTAQH
jgi:Zn-dependent metalloprotease